MAHRARIIALAALLAFTMAACTTSTDIAQRAESSTPSRASTTSLEATKEAPRGTEQKSSPSKRHLTRLWVNTEHHAVSGVTNIAGVAVFYEHVGGSLFITGLDPQSGTTLWSHLASPGDVAPGIAIQVAEVGDKVAYLEPVERYTPKDFESMLVLANARTGATVNQSGPGYFFDRPSACDHRPAQVCSQGRVGNRDDVRTYRLGTSGGLRPVRNQLPGDYSGIGPHGLVGDQGETDDRIGVARHGHLIWSRRVSKLFGAGFRTIAGWGFWYDDASGLIVGTVGYYVPGLYRYHLKRMNQTVGLRPESGEVVWRRRGSDPFCHPDRADEPGLGDFPLLACTWTSGVVIYPHHPKSGKHVQVKRAHLLLERLDPATGTSQWTVDLGHADEAVDRAGSTLLSLTGGSALFVDTGTRRLRVDWRTGRHRPVQASTIHWASDDTTFRYQVPWVVDGHSTRDRYGDGVFSPRSPSGRVVHRVPDSIPAGVGTDFPGSSVIVASKGRITAYTLGS